MGTSPGESNPHSGGSVIHRDAEFTVVVEEIGPFWRWLIFREGVEIQQGVSLSERSAHHNGLKVASFLRGSAD